MTQDCSEKLALLGKKKKKKMTELKIIKRILRCLSSTSWERKLSIFSRITLLTFSFFMLFLSQLQRVVLIIFLKTWHVVMERFAPVSLIRLYLSPILSIPMNVCNEWNVCTCNIIYIYLSIIYQHHTSLPSYSPAFLVLRCAHVSKIWHVKYGEK